MHGKGSPSIKRRAACVHCCDLLHYSNFKKLLQIPIYNSHDSQLICVYIDVYVRI